MNRPVRGAGAVRSADLCRTIRSGSPLASFDVRFPLLEATIVGCTLRRTKAGKLWCSPPKQRRQLPEGTTQSGDVVEWDGGGPAPRFSAACLEAVQRHSPELLTPLLEGSDELSSRRALPLGDAP